MRLRRVARITSKGQITVPRDVRRALGVGTGDSLLFEAEGKDMRVRPVARQSPWERYQGIGNPGLPSGRAALRRWLREFRGR